MASGKRASMREGPLAALFRKTETDGLEDPQAAATPPAPEPDANGISARWAPRQKCPAVHRATL